MKLLIKCLLVLLPFFGYCQDHAVNSSKSQKFLKDSLLIIRSDVKKGFSNSYVLFIPKGTPKNQVLYLLIEPNNSGILTDSIEKHEKSAIKSASISSMGNNISTELKIPLLIPIFPRLASKPLVYTHALDRDVMLEKSSDLKRLDLQLIAMAKDAREKLKELEVPTHEKLFMNGFSASGTFVNRFLFMHPQLVKAAAMGGINGELMLPLKKYNKQNFNYPLGINDLPKISGSRFDAEVYKKVPQYIYMGSLDSNDAVQFDDAYSDKERQIINSILGNEVQKRWKNCQEIYRKEHVSARFRTYENVGHWTTSYMNLDVIKFFYGYLKE